MNISKALKAKNRIAGEISKLQDILRRENSKRNDNPSSVDVNQVFIDLKNSTESLIQLKASISRASANISDKLCRISELKNFINWLNSLPTKEGEEKISYGHSSEIYTYKWTAFLNRQSLDKLIDETQLQVNNLQDEIDDYNAKTIIDYKQ